MPGFGVRERESRGQWGRQGSRPGKRGGPAGGRQPSPGEKVGIFHLRGEEGTLRGNVLPSPLLSPSPLPLLSPPSAGDAQQITHFTSKRLWGELGAGASCVAPGARPPAQLLLGVGDRAGVAAAIKLSESKEPSSGFL